ncbi:hypothetical protein ACFU5Y_04265 [Streptomyces gardneri]|uniref:hypothetical protein n=1 Tax=Streptomyces gardneri TaxID=66892 RepID=UPI0036923C24
MPEISHIIALRVTTTSGLQEEDVISADLSLTTRRAFSSDEIKAWAVGQIAEQVGKPAAALEVEHFAYTSISAP